MAHVLLVVTFFLILLTVLVNGGAAATVMRRLKLRGEDDVRCQADGGIRTIYDALGIVQSAWPPTATRQMTSMSSNYRTVGEALRHESHGNGRHVHISLGDAGPAALAALDQDASVVCVMYKI